MFQYEKISLNYLEICKEQDIYNSVQADRVVNIL